MKLIKRLLEKLRNGPVQVCPVCACWPCQCKSDDD